MKLRIKGNSIRLRLSQTEIDEFAKEGTVSDSIRFPNGQLIYVLQRAENEEFGVNHDNHFITVSVPKTKAFEWANSELVSLAEVIDLPENEELHILVEKDFQCLNHRPGEDESDLFPNPDA